MSRLKLKNLIIKDIEKTFDDTDLCYDSTEAEFYAEQLMGFNSKAIFVGDTTNTSSVTAAADDITEFTKDVNTTDGLISAINTAASNKHDATSAVIANNSFIYFAYLNLPTSGDITIIRLTYTAFAKAISEYEDEKIYMATDAAYDDFLDGDI